MLGLQYFSFQAVWSPMFLFAMIAVVIGYLYLIGPWREKDYPTEAPVAMSRRLMFIAAVIVFYLAFEGPLSLLGHILFSFHMGNMALLYLIAPPLVLLSVPGFIWKKAFSAAFWSKLKFFMHPIASLILFNMLFSVYHIPVVHDYVMTNFVIHRIYYVLLLIAAFMMWWQVITPIKGTEKLSYVKRMAYIFSNGVLLTPACALIIFSAEPLYAIYNDPQVWVRAMGYCIPGDTSYLLTEFGGPQYFNRFTVLEDQQAGGIVMKLLQETTFGIVLAMLFREWYNREHKQQANDEKLLRDALAIKHK